MMFSSHHVDKIVSSSRIRIRSNNIHNNNLSNNKHNNYNNNSNYNNNKYNYSRNNSSSKSNHNNNNYNSKILKFERSKTQTSYEHNSLILFKNIINQIPPNIVDAKENKNKKNLTLNFLNVQTFTKNGADRTHKNSSQFEGDDVLSLLQNEMIVVANEIAYDELGYDMNQGQLKDVAERNATPDPAANVGIGNNAQPNRFTDQEDSEQLMRLVMNGLGLQKLPNMQRVNISQLEYTSKYREYLRRVHERKRRELDVFMQPSNGSSNSFWDEETGNAAPLHILSIVVNNTTTNLLERHSERRHKRDDELQTSRRSRHRNTTASNSHHFNIESSSSVRGSDASTNFKGKTKFFLNFPLNNNATTPQFLPSDIEEANMRLMLTYSPALALARSKQNQNRQCRGGNDTRPKLQNGRHGDGERKGNGNSSAKSSHKQIINLKVYQRLRHGKRLWLDNRKIEIKRTVARKSANEDNEDDDEITQSQWLQFDVTKAVQEWLKDWRTNLGLEVQCDNCQRVGARILNDDALSSSSIHNDDEVYHLMPVLNIIGRLGASTVHHQQLRTGEQGKSQDNRNNLKDPKQQSLSSTSGSASSKSHCYKPHQRCCRHEMEVVFKEIKGFEFIIQPKVFDAGYCHGRCPPHYNPAHHHAILQSLIWKQSRERAPRPCCAPSKLVDLEVLHVDEKDSEKLKISTWTDMRVVECACS